MVWGAIWYGGGSPIIQFDISESIGKRQGKGRLHGIILTFTGVTSDIYRAQITEGPLLDSWKRVKSVWPGYGLPCVVEDNAPIYKAKKTRGRAIQLGMRFLAHPPSSPCLNPIEHVWNCLKRKLAALQPRPTSQTALFEEAVKIWEEIPQELIDRLIMSMPDRIDAVVEAEGGYIPY